MLEGQVKIGGQEHFYMETHGVRVVPTGEDGEIVVYSGEQHVTKIQVNVATSCQKSALKYLISFFIPFLFMVIVYHYSHRRS